MKNKIDSLIDYVVDDTGRISGSLFWYLGHSVTGIYAYYITGSNAEICNRIINRFIFCNTRAKAMQTYSHPNFKIFKSKNEFESVSYDGVIFMRGYIGSSQTASLLSVSAAPLVIKQIGARLCKDTEPFRLFFTKMFLKMFNDITFRPLWLNMDKAYSQYEKKGEVV